MSSSSSVGVSSSSGGGVSGTSTFKDDRDNKTYKTVKIGTQTWMAENLNYNTSTTGSKCYANSEANCTTYGRLYDWATAMALPSKCNSTLSTSDTDCGITTPKHKGVCPSGWHIPSDAEWTTLTDFVGGSSTAGTKLKATTGWNSYSGVPAGTDTYGFAALPGGCSISDGGFSYVGDIGSWWSTEGAYYRFMSYWFMLYSDEDVGRISSREGYYLFSVRCVQD